LGAAGKTGNLSKQKPLSDRTQTGTVKDYSKYEDISKGSHPSAGDQIAYKILEVAATGMPQLSNYKEASVVAYDDATDVVTLKPGNIQSIPLDGRQLEQDTNKQELLNQQEDVAWAAMTDVKKIS